MVSAIHKVNAHCVLRSSIGQYAAELPGRFIVSSIYAFLLWVILFFFILLPVGAYSVVLLCFAIGLFIHTITAFSCFGRIIMHTGAMGSSRIFDPEYELNLYPHLLHQNLLTKARAILDSDISIRRQYKDEAVTEPIRQSYSQEDLVTRFSERSESSRSLIRNQASSPLVGGGRKPKSHTDSARTVFGGITGSTRDSTNPIAVTGRTHAQNTAPYPKQQSTGNKPETRPRSNSQVKFSDGVDTAGERVKVGVECGENTGSTVNEAPTAMRTSSFKSEKPGIIKHNVSFGRSNVPTNNTTPTRTSSNSNHEKNRGVPTVTALAPDPTAQWIQQQQHIQQQRPSDGHPSHQQHSQSQQHLHYQGVLSSPSSATLPHAMVRKSTHERWLANGPSDLPASPFHQHHYGDPQQRTPEFNYVPAPPTSQFGFNQFAQQHYSSDPLDNSGAPSAVTAYSRGTSFGSIPSQIEQRTDSVDSDLESFAHFQGECNDEEDNVISYDDKDIDELLDSPPPPPNRLDSSNSIQTSSTKSTDGERQSTTTLLAGLAIEVDKIEETGNQASFGETGALLQRSERGNLYQSFDGVRQDSLAS